MSEAIEDLLRAKGLHLDLNARVMSKLLGRYELFKRILDLPGDIVEGGVYRGAALFLWANFLEIFGASSDRIVVGFDTFNGFSSDLSLHHDRLSSNELMSNNGEFRPRTREEVLAAARDLNLSHRIELIQGDVKETIPRYIEENPGFRVSLLNVDFDVYEPTKHALESLYPQIVPGGIVALDQYGHRRWGESQAADDFFRDKAVSYERLPWASGPDAFVVKRSSSL